MRGLMTVGISAALALALLVPEVDSNDIKIDKAAHEAQIAEIEKEMSRTQKNKATEGVTTHHVNPM